MTPPVLEGWKHITDDNGVPCWETDVDDISIRRYRKTYNVVYYIVTGDGWGDTHDIGQIVSFNRYEPAYFEQNYERIIAEAIMNMNGEIT